jgi:hypothetical protein
MHKYIRDQWEAFERRKTVKEFLHANILYCIAEAVVFFFRMLMSCSYILLHKP